MNAFSYGIEIAVYHQREEELKQMVTDLYNEVQASQENYDQDAQSTDVPQTIQEGEAILKQKETIIAGLVREKEDYERHQKDLDRRIRSLMVEQQANGVNPTLVNLEDNTRINNDLLKLYSFKRIIRNSFGIVDISQDGDHIEIEFDGR